MPFNPSEVTLPGSRSSEHADLFGFSGRTVSHFRVLELLGAGGMGVVYRAEDMRLQRAVALKFLLPQYVLDDSAKERFLLEARSAAALDHPNICTVYEVGETEDGQLYLAMPLYAGETLSARLAREGPLDTQEALAIARQLADGLACAHAAGIVHRDLKPSNLMLPPEGPVKILDFGLAKAKGLSLTRSGVQLGTVAYMAPEQICGEPVDPRTDLWALGVVLYEMLTGRRPYEGEVDISLARSIVNDEPAHPSTLRTTIPPEVETIVLRLLEKDPARRPPTAAELARDLEAAQAIALPVSSLPNGSERRAIAGVGGRRIWSRPGVVVGAVLAVALAVVASLALRARGRSGETGIPLERSIAVLPFANLSAAKENEFVAGGLQDAVITQLTKVTDLRVISSQSVRAYAGSAKSARDIGRELGVGRILQASVQRAGDSVRVTAHLVDARRDKDLWANQYERAATDLFALENDIALAIVRALQAELTTAERRSLTRPPTRSAEAYVFYLQGREYEQRPPGLGTGMGGLSESELRAAESLYRRALAIDPSFALAHAHLATVSLRLGNVAQMRAEAEMALRLDPDLPEAHLAIGWYWAWPGNDRDRALAEFEIARRGLPNDGQVAFAIAGVRRRQGHWREALAEFERAASMDPRHTESWVELAATYAAMRRYADAIRAWDHTVAIAPDNYRNVLERARVWVTWEEKPDSLEATLRQLPRDFDPQAQTTVARVDLARLRRRPRDGLAAFAAMRPEFFDSQDWGVAGELKMYRAQMYEALGDTAHARADFDAARVTYEAVVRQQPGRAHAHADLGMAYAGLGRRDDAVREARLSLEVQPLSRDAYFTPILMDHAAEVYMRVGDMDAAVDVLEQLSTIPNWAGLGFPAQLRFDPRWDPLRPNARFQRLVRRP